MDAGWDEADPPEAAPTPRKKHAGGRPKGRHNPNIDWELAERLYVEGELKGEAEHTERVYCSQSVIAKRAGTTAGNLAQRIVRYKWREKRDLFQAAHGIISGKGPDLVASDGKVISRKPLRRDAETILRAYIDLFADAVERRAIRYDTVADLDKAIRLLAFVRGQAESTKHTHVTVSLDVMQRRHLERRQLAGAHDDDDVAGVITVEGQAVEAQVEGDDEAALPAGWDEVEGPEVAAE